MWLVRDHCPPSQTPSSPLPSCLRLLCLAAKAWCPAGASSAPQKAAKAGKLRAVLSSTPEDGPETHGSAPFKLLPGRRMLESDASAASSRIGRGMMSPRSGSSELGTTTLSMGTTTLSLSRKEHSILSSTGLDGAQDPRRQSVAISLPDRTLRDTDSDMQTLRSPEPLAAPAASVQSSRLEQDLHSRVDDTADGPATQPKSRLWQESKPEGLPPTPAQTDPANGVLLNSGTSPPLPQPAASALRSTVSLSRPERASSLSLPYRRRLAEGDDHARYSLDSDRVRSCPVELQGALRHAGHEHDVPHQLQSSSGCHS